MTVRIGWARTDERPPGRVSGGLQLFNLLNVRNNARGKHVAVGVVVYNHADLVALRDKGRTMDLRVVGWLRFARDVTPSLVRETIGRTRVTGWISASPEVRRVLSG